MKNLAKTFKDLRKKGYFARQNFTCCQSCGWAEVPDERSSKAVFYHAQDKQSMNKNGDLYLAWSGNGREIVETFEENGFLVDWNGENNTRILVRTWI